MMLQSSSSKQHIRQGLCSGPSSLATLHPCWLTLTVRIHSRLACRSGLALLAPVLPCILLPSALLTVSMSGKSTCHTQVKHLSSGNAHVMLAVGMGTWQALLTCIPVACSAFIRPLMQ